MTYSKIILTVFATLFAIGSFLNLPCSADRRYSVTAVDRDSNPQFGGYFDTEFHANSSEVAFKAHRLILHVGARLHPKLRFNSEIEYEYGGLINSGADNGEIKIEQAWFEYEFSKSFIQRTGIVVIPFGRINVLHDSDIRDTTNRPIYAKYIVPSTWTDTGIGARGNLSFDDLELNYEAYIVNGIGSNISASNGIRKARPNFKMDNNKSKAFVGRVGISPYLGLEVGTSVYSGKYDSANSKNLSMLGFDIFWKQGPTEVLAEWAQNTLDISAGVPAKMWGYYVEIRHHLAGDWLKKSFLGSGFDHPVITLFTRFGAVDTDSSVITSKDITQITFGFNYRPMETVVYKFEYELNKENAGSVDDNTFIASVAVGF